MENIFSYNIFLKEDRTEKFKFNFFNIGMILFIILCQYNTAKWGPSISYVVIPALCFLFGTFTKKTYFDKNSFLIFLLFAVYFISTSISHYVNIERDMLSFFFFCWFFVLALARNYTKAEIRVFMLVYIFVAFSASCIIVYNKITNNFAQDWTGRSTFTFLGISKDPNYTMAYVTPAFILSLLIFFFSKDKKIKFFCFVCFAIMFASIFAASSRASMLAAAISLILIPIVCSQLKPKYRFALFIISLLVILLGYLIVTKTYSEYALMRFTEDKDGAGRLEIWNLALRVFKESPLLGGGFNSGSSVSLAMEGHTSHSILIDILSDAGLLGLTGFLVFYHRNCFWSNWDNFELQIVLGTSALIPLMFINGFNTTTFYFPMILFAVINKYIKTDNYANLFSY